MGLYQQADCTKITASAIITSNSALFFGMQIGTDGANDPVVTIYNGTTNAGAEILPTNTYDSSALGLNGIVLPYGKKAYNGIYVEITCSGTCEVSVDYREVG